MKNNKRDFDKNFLRLLKVKNINDKRVQGFINKHDIKLVDKEESEQGYTTVVYKDVEFVISKDYSNQTGLYVNGKNLNIDFKNFKYLDFEHIANVIDDRHEQFYNKHYKPYEPSKSEQYKHLKSRKQSDINIKEMYLNDIERLEKELSNAKQRALHYDDIIKEYDNEINKLLGVQ